MFLYYFEVSNPLINCVIFADVSCSVIHCIHALFIFFFTISQHLSPYRWFPEVQNIYYQGNKKRLLPSSQNAKRLEGFFNAASVLMTNILQDLALSSIDSYFKMFCPPKVNDQAILCISQSLFDAHAQLQINTIH